MPNDALATGLCALGAIALEGAIAQDADPLATFERITAVITCALAGNSPSEPDAEEAPGYASPEESDESPLDAEVIDPNIVIRGATVKGNRHRVTLPRYASAIVNQLASQPGTPMDQATLSKATGLKITSIFPGVSKARELFGQKLRLRGDEVIITHPAKRGSGQKAKYEWSVDYPVTFES